MDLIVFSAPTKISNLRNKCVGINFIEKKKIEEKKEAGSVDPTS